jgi:hypothetical protein
MLKAYDLLRRVLVEHLAEHDDLLKGELEADESYFGGKQKEREAAEQVTRQSYSGSWNEVEKYQSVFSQM